MYPNFHNSPNMLISPKLPINGGEIIRHEDHTAGRNGHTRQHDEKPLPMKQILLLCYARMIEPIAFFGIFPFVNKMIQETGNLAEADVGFYSGLIVSFILNWQRMLLKLFWEILFRLWSLEET